MPRRKPRSASRFHKKVLREGSKLADYAWTLDQWKAIEAGADPREVRRKGLVSLNHAGADVVNPKGATRGAAGEPAVDNASAGVDTAQSAPSAPPCVAAEKREPARSAHPSSRAF
jgi:hypothetical protein